MFRDVAGSEKAKAEFRANPKNKGKNISRSQLPKRSCWDGYTEGGSPTICAEGTNQHSGSHGVLHSVTNDALKDSGYIGKQGMPYTKARDLALDEISKAYGCNKKCLQAQLDAYYCGKAASKSPGCPDCKNATVTPNSGMGGSSNTPDENSDET